MTQDDSTPMTSAPSMFSRLAALASWRDPRVIGALMVLVIGVSALLWRPTSYQVLFANVSDADGGAIVAALQQMNVPYRYSEGGSAILVPQAQVHDTRLKLAGQGLPKSATVGFELLENQKFGTSQFVERVNYLRALEGELAKSIASIAQVKAARVHLVVPKPSAFVREQEKPRASVLVTLYPGRFMEPAQSAAIARLISTAVPGLQPQDVSLLDTEGGRLLPVLSHAGELDASQLRYAQEIEQSLSQRLGALLEPLTGRDGYRVQVSVELNFDERERTEEIYARNPDAKSQSVRSEQWADAAGGASGRAGGVPGALSNQPQTPPEVPIVRELQREASTAGERHGRNLQAPGAVETGQGRADGETSKRERTVNYELDRTVERYKKGRGQIRRLTAAVLIDDKLMPSNGKRSAFGDVEMEEIRRLVRDALGFDAERGDTVTVTNLPFNAQLRDLQAEPASTLQVPAMMGSLLELPWLLPAVTGAGVALLLVVLWLQRRSLKAQRRQQEEAARRASTMMGEQQEDAMAHALQREQWRSSGEAGASEPGVAGAVAAATGVGDAATASEAPPRDDPVWQQQRQELYAELMGYLKSYVEQQPEKLSIYLRAWMASAEVPPDAQPQADGSQRPAS